MSYLLGLPQEVENLGLVYPVKIKDYARFSIFTWTVEKTKKSLNKEDSEYDTFELLLEENLSKSKEEAYKFIYCLQELIKIVLKEKDVEFIYEKGGYKIGSSNEELRFLNSSNFDEFAEVVRRQNVVFEKRYHTPLFQKRIDEELAFEKRKNKGSSIETIYQILSTKMGISYNEISDMTYMQVVSNYQRIMAEKAYDTTVQLKAGGFECEIEDYSRDLDIFKHPEDSLYKKKKGSELTSSFGI